MFRIKSVVRTLFSSLALASLSASLFAPAAHAQGVDTLERIMKTHVVNIGVRDGASPFSTLDKDGKAMGYSIDICHKVVELMRKDLKIADLRAQEVVVSAANRFDKLKDGSIDLECTLTSNTKSRQKEFDFSYAILFGAQRFLTDPKYGMDSQADLPGKSIAVVKGTAGEKIMTYLQGHDYPTLKLVHVANNDAALAELDAGRVQGILQMDVLLESLRLRSKTPQRFSLTAWPMTVEPIAFPLRKDDKRFATAVNAALRTLYGQGDFKAIYDRWLNAQIKVPMSALMMENMHRPSADPGFALVLGVDL